MDVQMRRAGQERDQAAQEAYAKTEEIEGFPTHRAFLREAGCNSGRRTWNRRSVRPGVSRIDSINNRHLRESSCIAKLSSARLTSGSRENRSAPPISQRSN